MLPTNTRPLARLVLLSLMLTFIVTRLVSIGAYLLFSPRSAAPTPPAAAVIYGIGLGLTFDEFGMWLHLNGDYWQRASFDAIVVLAATLCLAGFAPPIRRWRSRRALTFSKDG